MISRLPELAEAITHLKNEVNADADTASTQKREKYLGKKGKFNELAQALKTLLPENRKDAGRMLNELKEWLHEQLPVDTQTDTVKQSIDPTLPGIDLGVGHVHPISHAIHEITQIFERIGFTRVRYPEAEGDWYAFGALNMPKSHPARDEWETFFLDLPEDPKLGKIVLTPHTSSGQVREMERLGSTPPIRMINICKTYRRQADVTHLPMFHQFEGLVVDKGINIQHLKGTIEHFAQEFYGPSATSRIRPFHFMFTEPSFEVDFSCTICNGTGVRENGEKCKFCKSGWHEVGGAGMVHPNVLRAGGIDPDVYSGFAFGWGIERTYTLRPGLHIDDIRMLYNGDLRLLEQF